MTNRQITYYRERVYYKNIYKPGKIVETVICYAPELSYKYQIFILHDGQQTGKLYRRSLSGAKKTALKQLVFSEDKKPKTVFANINGKKVAIPKYMEITVRRVKNDKTNP